jgi:alpha-glucosidase (family GH31 glycosyl hydrolase)
MSGQRRCIAVFVGTVSLLCAATCGGQTNAPVWLDRAPLTKQSAVFNVDKGGSVRVDVLGDRLFRIRYSKSGAWTESALNRYKILASSFPAVPFTQNEEKGVFALKTSQASLAIRRTDGGLVFAGADGRTLTEQPAPVYKENGGYDVRFGLAKDERIYGLGDVSRDNVMRRGGRYEVWVLNVTSYIPIPMALSSRGWGMLMNTTWRNTFDVGKSDPDAMICTAARSDVDYYLFCGADYRALLETYTSLTGRPALLPVWGYAFTYVCNQNIDAFNLVNEAMEFRRQDMPCDVIGLEPGWMSKNYDQSTKKTWHPQRFPIPYWAPKGPHTFLGALARKGFKLSLWLCCEYDLSVYEEQCVAGTAARPDAARDAAANGAPEVWHDDRIEKEKGAKNAPAAAAAEGSEPWFSHLEKFVDQGVSCFKLDGCAQVVEHPKRAWGNGMSDEEMHNLYPVVYAKQMAQGFEAHAKRRSMVYSAGGYAGVQRFVATWAGDTGGGAKPLASMLNLGFSGHSNHSCDMDINSLEGIHFGFLQTWAQQNNWDYWYQPWLNKDELIPVFRAYDQLRYRLLPYLYSEAAEAAQTGYPVMRAMPLVYTDDPAWDACLGQYMLGDFLLVSAYAKQLRLPPGVWTDFWTGQRVQGPSVLPVKVGDGHGGALLVKEGAILPTWPVQTHVEKGWSPDVGLLVYPAAQSAFTLYEDDGVSLGYRTGAAARTRITCATAGRRVTLTIGAREGSFAGMPPTRTFTASIHVEAKPQAVALDGVAIADVGWDAVAKVATVTIPACGDRARSLTLE